MSQPQPPMSGQQRQQLVAQIGQLLARAVPPGWYQLRAEYRAAGRHVEIDAFATGQDGIARAVQPPPEVVRLFGRLRADMYQPERGTWLAAIISVTPSAAAQAEFFIDQEPRWRRVPPPVGFQDELRFFPRRPEHTPGWLSSRAGLPVAATQADGGELRSPRVWDAVDESGRPVVDREPLPPTERELVLEYLDAAPVVLAARSFDTDAFDPDREPQVPLTFRTDGTWVWPGAVAYYLREHDLPPDPDFLRHLRARAFRLPEVDEDTRTRAVEAIAGGPPVS
jgi:hypothetical protein